MDGILSSTPAGMPAPPASRLPLLRPELRWHRAAPQPDGSPAWTLHDPVSNRFFRIGWLDAELLSEWHRGDPQAVVAAVRARSLLQPDAGDLQRLGKFLQAQQLLRLTTPVDLSSLREHHAASRHRPLNWLLHRYLFFRVPLVRPQFWLARCQPALQRLPLGSVIAVVAMLTGLGLALLVRQWDTFVHTLTHSLSASGLLGYAVALAVAKTVHELGHALAATRHGVRVGHMGVAFLVMLPMLYTDTGESWRLSRSRDRLVIASAGMAVELALAGLCTLAWSLAPPGAWRDAFFFLATTSWVMTLAVNASPFMRFDGYFILSDALDLPNLHERSGALARTALRRSLLGWDEAWPEAFSLARRRGLIAFALVTWFYRFVVFLAIALLVYHFFFKALGVVLMAIELHVFIVRPVARELSVWRSRWRQTGRWHAWLWCLLPLCLAPLLVVPWSGRVSAPGWVHPATQQLLHVPLPAQVVRLTPAARVRAGDVLFVLDQPTLALAEAGSRDMAQARERQIAGLLGLAQGEARRAGLVSQKARHEAEARLSADERQRLVIRAPFDGELLDIDPDLAPGVWVHPAAPLALLADRATWVVDAYLPEDDLHRLAVGARARVHHEAEPWRRWTGRVTAIDPGRTMQLPAPWLDARHGGPLQTEDAPSRTGPKALSEARFRVRIALDAPSPPAREAVVQVQIDAQPASLLARWGRHLGSVLIRNSGF